MKKNTPALKVQKVMSKTTKPKSKSAKVVKAVAVKKSVKASKAIAVVPKTPVTVPTKSAPRQVGKRAAAGSRNVANSGTANNNKSRKAPTRKVKQAAVAPVSGKGTAAKQRTRGGNGVSSRKTNQNNVAVKKSAGKREKVPTLVKGSKKATMPRKVSKAVATKPATTRTNLKGGTTKSRNSGSKSTGSRRTVSHNDSRSRASQNQTGTKSPGKGSPRNPRASSHNIRTSAGIKTSRIETNMPSPATALMPQLPVDLMAARQEVTQTQLPLSGDAPCFGLALRNGNKIYLLDRTLQAYASSNQPEEFQPFSDLKTVKMALETCDIRQVLSDLHVPLEDHSNVSIAPIEMRALGAAASIDISINWKPCQAIN